MNGKDAYKTFMVLILTFGIWYKKFVSNNA
jgi:hypothetical protein